MKKEKQVVDREHAICQPQVTNSGQVPEKWDHFKYDEVKNTTTTLHLSN